MIPEFKRLFARPCLFLARFHISMVALPFCCFGFQTMASDTSITVTVNFNEIDTKGKIYIAMYRSPDAWENNHKSAYSTILKVDSEHAQTHLSDIEPGVYAIKCFLDENGNGKIDTNLLGIPSEQFGFSNNVGRFGMPDFAEASFNISNDHSITIKMR